MSAGTHRGGGSFRELRERHLPLFLHNHHRTRPKEKTADKPGKAAADKERARRRAWKTIGILHFPAHDDD